jgi:hypothetical protein
VGLRKRKEIHCRVIDQKDQTIATSPDQFCQAIKIECLPSDFKKENGTKKDADFDDKN